MELAVLDPVRTSVMIKPVGPACNLNCTYCYYLPRHALFDGKTHRMEERILESIFAGLLPRMGEQVTIGWQGGEPTLAGVPFFERAVELQQRHARPGQMVNNTLQTNGTLLDEQWCRFFKAHEFLIGVSLDGPGHFHDHYRVDRQKKPTRDRVLRGIELMRRYEVEHNVLCVLNDRNVQQPTELFNSLVNQGLTWLQFIPAIEWEDEEPGRQPRLTSFSPAPAAYGEFLCAVFDLWFAKHRHRVSVRLFDAVLQKLVSGHMPFCMLESSCDAQITVEHDGSLFVCDHFVERRWELGRIGEKDEAVDTDWPARLDRQRQAVFADRKTSAPPQCAQCRWRSLCYGGCPKHRRWRGDQPEPTILCESYRALYSHAMERFEWLAGYLRQGRQPPPPEHVAAQVEARAAGTAPREQAGRNDPCPCGSGLKFKKCHGRG